MLKVEVYLSRCVQNLKYKVRANHQILIAQQHSPSTVRRNIRISVLLSITQSARLHMKNFANLSTGRGATPSMRISALPSMKKSPKQITKNAVRQSQQYSTEYSEECWDVDEEDCKTEIKY